MFRNCSVRSKEGKGGAISIESTVSKTISIEKNQFHQCHASRGGAIFWDYNEPALVQNNFEDNSVKFYGSDIGSYGCKVQIISE